MSMTPETSLAIKKYRRENPHYANLDDESLYYELKPFNPNLSWVEMDAPTKGAANTSPGYLNSFQSWLDGPISKSSWNWTREAYNRSLQGMTDQLITGKQRYDLDKGYDLNVLEDIGATALSFMMPLDFLAMAVGGTAARGGLALAGITKKSGQLAGKFGMKHIIPQMAQQAGSLSVYEGAIGGVQAAIDGDDVWEGITDGAMHGAVLGGLAGGVGGGLGYMNAELIRSLEGMGKLATATKKATEMLGKTDRAKLMATGMIGQIGAEAGVFTAAEQAENVKNGGDFRFGEALKSYAKNIGLFGVLKAKSKVVEKVFAKGNAHLDMLEAAERERLGIKEDGTSSEGRQFDNIIQDFIKKEQESRDKGEIGQAEAYKELREKYLADKVGVDPEHKKAVEDYNSLRSMYSRLKSKGLSEDTISDFLNLLNGYIGVEGRLIKNATKATAPFYKSALSDFKKTEKELLELSKNVENPHTKTGEKEGVFKEDYIIKEAERLNLDISDLVDIETKKVKPEHLKTATRQIQSEQMRLGEVKGAGLGKTFSIKEAQGLRDPAKISEENTKLIIEDAKKGTGLELKKVKEGRERVRTAKDNQFVEIDNAFPDKGISKISKVHKNILADVVNLTSKEKITPQKIKDTSNFLKWVEKKYNASISDLTETQQKTLARDWINKEVGFDVFLTKGQLDKLNLPLNKIQDGMSKGLSLYRSLSDVSDVGLRDFLSGRQLLTAGLKQPKVETSRTVVVGKEGRAPRETIEDAAVWAKGQVSVGTLDGAGASLAIRVANLFRVRSGELRFIEHDLINPQTGTIGYKSSKRGKVRTEVDLALAKDLYKWSKSKGKAGKDRIFELTPEEFGGITIEAITSSGGEINIYQGFEGKLYGWDAPIVGASKQKGGERASFGRNPAEIYRRKYETQADQAMLQKVAEERGHSIIAAKHYIVGTKQTTLPKGPKTEYQLESAATNLGISVKELKAQTKWVKENYPELDIQLKDKLGKFRGEYVLGRITGHLIEIAKGRANADTIPHEVSHHVIDILEAFGDKKSKNLIREGVSKFGSNEKLVQSVGEFVTGRMRNKSMASKVKNWLQKFWSNMKTKLGIHNEADVARLLGERVLEGKLPKGKLAEVEVKYQTEIDPKRNWEEMRKVKAQYKAITKKNPELDRKIKKQVFGTDEVKLDKVTLEQIGDYGKLLSEAIVSGKAGNIPVARIPEINDKYHVSPEASTEILKLMGIKDGMHEYASKEQAQEYSSYIRHQYNVPEVERTSATDIVDLSKTKFAGGYRGTLRYLARGMMPVWLVLRKYGGKPGNEIAKRLLNHEWAEHVLYKGIGDKNIYLMKQRLGKNSDLIKLFDAERAERNYKDGSLTAREKAAYEDIYIKKDKNSDTYKAHQTWSALTEKYWQLQETELSRHQTPEGVRRIMKELNRKKVEGYMTRRLTREALEHVTEDSNFITELVNKNIMGGGARAEAKRRLEGKSKEEIDILEERLKDISTTEGQKLYEDTRTDLYNAVAFGYTNVKNPHLIERNDLLKEYINVNKNGKMKKIKVYEDSLGATAETYVARMSKYLASVRHFPEWTGVGSKYKIDTSKRALMEQMENNPDMGGYAIKAIKRQLGVDRSDMQALNRPAYKFLGMVTNTSAALGLSSPLSGIKNMMIGIPRSIGDFGLKNTFYGIKRAFDSTAWSDARRKGFLEYGAKTLELQTVGWGRFNMSRLFRLNLMTRTENINRIISSHAGHLYFAEAQAKIRGEKGMFKMGTNKKRMKRLMEELWHLDAEEINFIEKTKDFGAKEALNKHAEIMNKVGHFSHVSSQGGTSAVLLPLWMSSKEMKPFTLFQRMATATTIDSYRNFVKPILEFGNFMPLARAAVAHSVSGAFLYLMYDELFGKTKPIGSEKSQDDMFSKILMNLWRSEFLGVFGEVLSPYEKELSVPISTPIIVRNLKEAGNAYRQVMLGGKTITQAAGDYAKNTFVLGAQLFDAFPKAHFTDLQGNKYYRDFMKLRAFKHKWTTEVHKQSPWSADHRISKREPFYRDLKYALMFESEDKIAQRYWQAFNAVTGQILKEDTYKKPWKAAKEAREAIKKVIKYYDPYHISDDVEGTTKSKQDQFLDWLTPENKAMAKSVKKQYEFKQRQYLRIITMGKYRNLWSAYPGI